MAKSIYDYDKYICAPELGTRRPTLTIARIEGDVDFTSSDGRKSKGWDIYFKECKKPYGLISKTTKDQLCVVTGTTNPDEMLGKKIMLFSVCSKRSESGVAIRIGKPQEVRSSVVGAVSEQASKPTTEGGAE